MSRGTRSSTNSAPDVQNINIITGYDALNTNEAMKRIVYLSEPKMYGMFQDSLENYAKDVFDNEDINILESQFDKKASRQLYGAIIKSVPQSAYNIFSASCKDDGPKAIKMLRNHYLGTKKTQRMECLMRIGEISLSDNDDVVKFTNDLKKLAADTKSHKILAEPSADNPNGGEDLLVGLAVKRLPEKFQVLANNLRSTDFPNVDVFCQRLTEEDRIIRDLQNGKRGSVNVASLNTNPRKRKRFYNKAKPQATYNAPSNSSTVPGAGPMTASAASRSTSTQGPRHGAPSAGVRQNRGPIRAVTCKRCLSRNGSHTEANCSSTKWCHGCKNASHNSNQCWKQTQ